MKTDFLTRGKAADTFFCFSPPVMLATFLIELLFAAYAFVRYRMTAFGRLSAAMLVLLGTFQLAEYEICGGVTPLLWSRIGFVAITLLPPSGIHLIALLTGKRNYVSFGYALAAAYSAIFLFATNAMTAPVCGGNYVIFGSAQDLAWTYSVYYFGFLLLGLWEIIDAMHFADRRNFSLLAWMAAGYSSFMVPMWVVYSLSPAARAAIPSVMCGFAVMLAVILGIVIVPKYHASR